MSPPKVKWSFLLVLTILSVPVLIIVSAGIWLVSYDDQVKAIIGLTGKYHLEGALRDKYFTVSKYHLLRYFLPVLAICTLFILSKFKNKIAGIHLVRPFVGDVVYQWRQHRPRGMQAYFFLLIILFIIGKAVYYIVTSPIQYDEAWSYNYYTTNPWYLTPFIYSNYPLYELLTHITKWLPLPMYINLRLPALLTGIGWSVALYICTGRLLNKNAGMVAMALGATLPAAALYMLHAKGFLLVALFSLIHFSILAITYTDGWNATRKRWLAAAVFLGFWSSPVFLLPFTINSTCFLLLSFKKRIRQFLIATSIGLLPALLVYSLVLAGSGFDPLLQSSALDVAANERHTMWWHIKFIALWITGLKWGWVIFAALLICTIVLCMKKRYEGLVALVCFSSIILVPLIAGSYLFPRVWIFLLVPVTFTIASVLRPLPSTHAGVIFATLFFLCINTYSYAVYVERTWSISWDKTSAHISRLFLEKGITSYYTDFDYLLPVVEYHYRLKGAQIKAFVSNPRSLQHGYTEKVEAIVDAEEQDLQRPPVFKQVYTDSTAKVYLKND